MAQLLVAIPLDSLQKVGHEDGLFLKGLLLDAVVLCVATLDLGKFFKLSDFS